MPTNNLYQSQAISLYQIPNPELQRPLFIIALIDSLASTHAAQASPMLTSNTNN